MFNSYSAEAIDQGGLLDEALLSGVSRSVAVLAVLVGGAGRAVGWAAEPARLRVAGGVPHGGRDVHIRYQ